MSYRLPTLSTTACSTAGCAASTAYDDHLVGARAAALADWEIGAGHTVCPDHRRRFDVLHFAA